MADMTSDVPEIRRHRPHRVAAALLVLPLAPLLAGPTTAAEQPTPPPVDTAATNTLRLPEGFRPEGIAADPDGVLYVGSLADGRIWSVDPRTGGGGVLTPGATARQLRGMEVDPRTGLLWAAGNDGTTGIVLAVDTRTGLVRRTVPVEDAGFLNDLVVTRTGVWVTDSRVDRLLRIPLRADGRPADSPVSLLPIIGDWPVTDGLRANGIRQLPDGTLVLAHSTAGGPFLLDPRTGVSRRLQVTGGPPITGGDGLVLAQRTLMIVRGTGATGIAVLGLECVDGGWTARWRDELTDPSLDVPSTAARTPGRLWVVNARFGVADPTTAAFWISEVLLPGR
jgi:sugar lactone lactonase YvrE